ncbi:MAG: ASCH domain-containing protein [Clostridia bacterium]|nr:ASCH domain-containing protein [Clostridia bacterium]
MSKAVLMSIQPKWVEKIASGEKTIEVRKSRPKLETPFKCYIYATWNGNNKEILVKQDGQLFCKDWRKANGLQRASGKVIGEFVCDRIDRIGKRGINNNFDYCFLSLNEWGNDDIEIEITDIQKSCISKSELNAYGANSSCLYAWHITDLKIYDKPKELSEFFHACKQPKGTDCSQCIDRREKTCYSIKRPPQSWCYVELQNG